MPAVAAKHAQCHVASLRSDFPVAMTREIRSKAARIVRIHVAGDFYAADYVAKWTQIAAHCRPVTFFFYTRSWRVPELLDPLTGLAAQPNVFGWWSEDRETGPSPRIKGVRVAYLVAEAADELLVPAHADLVFRDRRHLRSHAGALKRVQGITVCPHEQGGATTALSCSQCRLCFRPPTIGAERATAQRQPPEE